MAPSFGHISSFLLHLFIAALLFYAHETYEIRPLEMAIPVELVEESLPPQIPPEEEIIQKIQPEKKPHPVQPTPIPAQTKKVAPHSKKPQKAALKKKHAPPPPKEPDFEEEEKKSEISFKRYEQILAGWFNRIKPEIQVEKGLRTYGILHIRVDRQGKIIGAALDASTGITFLDEIIMEMVDAADPVPAPGHYISDEAVHYDFLLPIHFNG